MYHLDFTERARNDADAAHDWLAENASPAYAEQWYQGLFKQVETLTDRPNLFPVARESCKFPETIQELVYGKVKHKHKYRILFTVREQTVVVLSILHSSREDFEP